MLSAWYFFAVAMYCSLRISAIYASLVKGRVGYLKDQSVYTYDRVELVLGDEWHHQGEPTRWLLLSLSILISHDHAVNDVCLTIQAFIFNHSQDSFNDSLHIGSRCSADHSIKRIIIGLVGKISLKISSYRQNISISNMPYCKGSQLDTYRPSKGKLM